MDVLGSVWPLPLRRSVTNTNANGEHLDPAAGCVNLRIVDERTHKLQNAMLC
jgi:hypothetical protein